MKSKHIEFIKEVKEVRKVCGMCDEVLKAQEFVLKTGDTELWFCFAK